jgi:hypothetical protein
MKEYRLASGYTLAALPISIDNRLWALEIKMVSDVNPVISKIPLITCDAE